MSKQVVSGCLLPRRPAHPQRAFLPKREVRLSLPGRLSEGETLINQMPKRFIPVNAPGAVLADAHTEAATCTRRGPRVRDRRQREV